MVLGVSVAIRRVFQYGLPAILERASAVESLKSPAKVCHIVHVAISWIRAYLVPMRIMGRVDFDSIRCNLYDSLNCSDHSHFSPLNLCSGWLLNL